MRGLGARLGRVVTRVREEIDEALTERYTPRQVAASFAVGVFVTSLPTLGTGLLLLFVLAYLFAGVSKIGLFASAVVFNPVVKLGVYGTSFWVGRSLLGPVPTITVTDVSLSAAPEIVVRLVAGNLLLAVLFTVVSYVVAYRFTVEYRRQNGNVGRVERVVEAAIERLPRR
jgi:uncharacterized protein (DUF2062 family)